MSARLEIGHADPADLALRLRGVGVVAHLGRQVEGDRQPGLALLEEVAEAPVRLLGGREAGVLAHRPEPAPVHRRLDAAGERVLAGPAEVAVLVEAGRVGRRVQVADDDPRRGLERLAALGGAPERLGADGLAPAVARRVGRLAGRAGRMRPGVVGRAHSRTSRRSPTSIVRPAPTATREIDAVARSAELVLHLHRLHHEELLAGHDRVARHDRHRDHHARDDGMDLGRSAMGRLLATPARPFAERRPALGLDLDLDPPAVDDDLAPPTPDDGRGGPSTGGSRMTGVRVGSRPDPRSRTPWTGPAGRAGGARARRRRRRARHRRRRQSRRRTPASRSRRGRRCPATRGAGAAARPAARRRSGRPRRGPRSAPGRPGPPAGRRGGRARPSREAGGVRAGPSGRRAARCAVGPSPGRGPCRSCRPPVGGRGRARCGASGRRRTTVTGRRAGRPALDRGRVAAGRARPGRPPASPTRAARRNSAGPSHHSPTQPVDRSPARNGSLRATNRWNGRVVWMPAISVSSRARRSRSMAASRSPAWTRILAMRLSYSAGTRSPGLDPGVDPDARACRHDPAADPAGGRREVPRRILGGDPDLDGVAGRVGGSVRRRPAPRPTAAGRRPARTARGRCRGRTRARSRRARPGAGC